MKIFDALNEQMNFELESAYLYRQMAGYLADQGMDGMAHFMNEQVAEEVEHSDKIRQFLYEVNYRINYRAIDPGSRDYDSILDVFQKALDHEKVVTSKIHDLVRLAREEGELRAESMLQWFVNEQVEEEDNFTTLVEQLERVDGHWEGLYMLDNSLAQR